MTTKQEKLLKNEMKQVLEKVRFQSMKAGATGILGAVLNMCNEGKTVHDIKKFCETSLSMDGMK